MGAHDIQLRVVFKQFCIRMLALKCFERSSADATVICLNLLLLLLLLLETYGQRYGLSTMRRKHGQHCHHRNSDVSDVAATVAVDIG